MHRMKFSFGLWNIWPLSDKEDAWFKGLETGLPVGQLSEYRGQESTTGVLEIDNPVVRIWDELVSGPRK